MELVVATVFFLCMSCAPAIARDLTGLIDLHGKEIIPCKYRTMKYIGCGFYLAEEILPSNSKGKQLVERIPSELLEKVENHSQYSEKVLLTRNGAKLNPRIPKDAVLTDVYLPSGEDRWDPVKTRTFEAKVLPKDAIVYFMGKSGFGACDAKGNILVKPNIEALKGEQPLFGGVCPEVRRFIPQRKQKNSSDSGSKFETPRRFSEGLGVFRNEHWKFGYMNENGKVVIPAKFSTASDFSEGMAAVSPSPAGGAYCFIDKTGARVSPDFDYVSEYFNGIAAAGKSTRRTRIGASPQGRYYIDKQFKVVSPTFDEAGPFHGSVAVVKPVGELDKPEVGLVDRNFRYTFLCKGNKEFKFQNGYWIIEDWISPAIVLDGNGKEIFRTPGPARLEDSFGGLVFRGRDLNQLYFYDKGGRLVFAPRLEKHWLFSTRLPMVLISEGTDWNGMRGILGKNAGWLVLPERANFEITESDRAIKSIFGRFEKDDWKIQDDGREHEFYAFLRECNPVGMKKDEIENLLGRGTPQKGDSEEIQLRGGKPDQNIFSYQLNWFGAWCGSSMWFAEFLYDNSRVKEWRIYKRTERVNPWIRS